MELAIIGLGRMGGNMVLRLLKDGHRVVAYNRSPGPIEEAERAGAVPAHTLEEIIEKLATPRVVWMMIPAGEPVTQMIESLLPLLSEGDILVDGGNSNWKDSVQRAAWVKEHGISYMDAGTSGGIWGLEVGYCVMVGGDPDAFAILEPAIKSLAPENGYRLVGPSGAGHFSKMIHNGIEYGMMQSYAEGFEILKASPYDYDLAELSHLWNQGSVVRSWLLLNWPNEPSALTLDWNRYAAMLEIPVRGAGTVFQAIDSDVPAPVLTLSLMARFRSRQEDSFAAKVTAALRREFGGHAVKTEIPSPE